MTVKSRKCKPCDTGRLCSWHDAGGQYRNTKGGIGRLRSMLSEEQREKARKKDREDKKR